MNIHRSPLDNPESTWFNQAVLLLHNTEMCRTIKIAALKMAQTVWIYWWCDDDRDDHDDDNDDDYIQHRGGIWSVQMCISHVILAISYHKRV